MSRGTLSLNDLPVLMTAVGTTIPHGSSPNAASQVLLPGSFNPVHAGHWELAAVAERLLGRAVVFELSVANVDKPVLNLAEIERRVAQFSGRADVWITRAPLFGHKAKLFPGATFVVGADTAVRLVSARYYGADPAQMHGALASLRSEGCRFLVAARCFDATQPLLTLADVPIPDEHRDLFTELPVAIFRCDLSSTQLRQAATCER
jgi:hypothetical protein